MQPERNHQERGNVSYASVSITGRLVKQLAVGLNWVNCSIRQIYVYLVFIRGAHISAAVIVVLKRRGANSSLKASLCSQETPRLLCF